MAYTVIIHMLNDQPLLADMEELPDPNSQALHCTNLRQKDGKDVGHVDMRAASFLIPWHRITLVELIGGEEETEIVGFVREK